MPPEQMCYKCNVILAKLKNAMVRISRSVTAGWSEKSCKTFNSNKMVCAVRMLLQGCRFCYGPEATNFMTGIVYTGFFKHSIISIYLHWEMQFDFEGL
jgi:hypothetical protein